MSVAALPMEPPFDTPLQPLSEAQLQVQTFALQVAISPTALRRRSAASFARTHVVAAM